MSEMKVKTVCLVCNTAWGILNFRLNLIRELVGLGFRVVAIAPYEESAVNGIKSAGAIFYSIGLDNRGANPFKDAGVFFALIRCYLKFRPSLVIHYTIKPVVYGGWAAAVLRVPSLAVITGLGYAFLNSGLKAVLARNLYRSALLGSKEVWFLNAGDQSSFVKRGLVSADKCYLLPGEGVDVSHFSPAEFQPKNESVRFLLVARLLYDKGIGEFAEAGLQLTGLKKDLSCGCNDICQLSLLGPFYPGNPQAIDAEVIQDWESAGAFNYLGASDDVRPFVSECDVLVLPSYGEGLPRTVLEAMSMGKPVIATNVNGCRELVQHGVNGLLCEPRSAESLAHAMQAFMALSAEQRCAMGKAGRERVVAGFSDEVVLAFYRAFLKRAQLI